MKQIILTVILIVAILSFSPRKENKNREVKLDKSIRILNFSKFNYADTIVSIGVSTLKIKNVNVVIVPLTFKEELNPFLLGYIEYSDNYYTIKLSSYLSKDEAILVIAHELTHLHQFYYKRLLFTEDNIIFDGFYYNPYMDYSQRPWEREAFLLQDIVKANILKKLNPLEH